MEQGENWRGRPPGGRGRGGPARGDTERGGRSRNWRRENGPRPPGNNTGNDWLNHSFGGARRRNPTWTSQPNRDRSESTYRQGRESTPTANAEATNNQKKNSRSMGFRYLESLLEKDTEEVVLKLSNDRTGFLRLCETQLTNDFVVLVLMVLRKIIDSPFGAVKYSVVHAVFKGTFLDTVINFVNGLPVQSELDKKRSGYFWKNPDEFWRCLVVISTDLFRGTPSFAALNLPKLLESLTVYIPVFESRHHVTVSADIKSEIESLHCQIQDKLKEDEQKKESRNRLAAIDNIASDEEPPDNFHDISVYPSAAELKGKEGFLRPNIVQGPYRNIHHYLDVQFRLLREDFVRPLRTAIQTHLSPVPDKKQHTVRIHRRVRFLHPEVVNKDYCVRLQFDFSDQKKTRKNRRVDFERSKRFLHGSLLCFTSDNFRTIFFGKVANREVKVLNEGQLTVGFAHGFEFSFELDYLMVECTVYFEPYYHVLGVLKTLSEQVFPMEKYIIKVDPTPQPPTYQVLRGLPDDRFAEILRAKVDRSVQLNESQRVAFKAAMSEEFVLIQGPPGTGKTFLGLHIAKTLLSNEQYWNRRTPMLVICYTNHALDQFLEGLSNHTERIIRVGGQSKNEKLQQFNLRTKKSSSSGDQTVHLKRLEVKRLAMEIQKVGEALQFISSFTGVLDFDVFRGVIPDYERSWFSSAEDQDIVTWLFGGRQQNQRNLNEEQLEAPLVVDGQGDDEGEEILEAIENDQTEQEIIDFDELFDDVKKETSLTVSLHPLIDLKKLQSKIVRMSKELEEITASKGQLEEVPLYMLVREQEVLHSLPAIRDDLEYLKFRLVEGYRNQQNPTPPKYFNITQAPQFLKPDNRWRLYFYWCHLYKETLERKLNSLNDQFREAYEVYEQLRDVADVDLMRKALVIGMTTTCAARLRNTLQVLRSPIVIVEEAAEVLEAHIVAALTVHCKHLILIGDHQQLKPSTADYRIETKYQLGISLFERMVINKVNCYTLNVQHRMRPEISKLIRPTIYPFLMDHESVNARPNISGLDKCLYFIDHQQPEQSCDDSSKRNKHESTFLIYLARHLILNGYEPENITILAAYLGQMYEMQGERKNHLDLLKDVRIAVLDNYQGEESDIILLSLVRNNDDNKIGFLKIDNRVCVALSRARNGMYIMGNMKQLCDNSELWCKINALLKEQDAVGPKLPLRCQVHTDTITEVKCSEDFYLISEGGCSEKCGKTLGCGHKCTVLCHVRDRSHVTYKCQELCDRPLCNTDPTHLCKKKCFEDCGVCIYKVRRHLKACDHVVDLECHIDVDAYMCTVPVRTQLPCDHTTDKPCHIEAEKFRCPFPCDIKIEPCGHACTWNCHIRKDPDHLTYKCFKNCAKSMKDCSSEVGHPCPKRCHEECPPCDIPVKKKRNVCPHFYRIACSEDVDKIQCTKPCGKDMECGHRCKKMCGEPCVNCQIEVTKEMPVCGHKVKLPCHVTPDRSSCDKKCPLKLPCGHPCTNRCNVPCTEKCQAKIDHSIMAKCGHNINKIRCYMKNSGISEDDPNLLRCCTNPCNTMLKCGHPCSGTCGECYQGRVHKRCSNECNAVLVCNHKCRFPCREACRPCNLKCNFSCPHSKCGKLCGEPCTPCKEKCKRQCPHRKCSNLCGEICSVPPCEMPCQKRLKCGHNCIGFCGDRCPPKCMVCDEDEVLEIFFGTEDEDALYVYLNDCKHIVESTGMEHWLEQNENVNGSPEKNSTIGLKVCPRCKKPIETTQRYSDYVKRAMKEVAKVKTLAIGTSRENEEKCFEILKAIARVDRKLRTSLLSHHTDISTRIEALRTDLRIRLLKVKGDRRQVVTKADLAAISTKVDFLLHTLEACGEGTSGIFHPNPIPVFVPQVTFIVSILSRDLNSTNEQEVEDLGRELQRLKYMVLYHDKIINDRAVLQSPVLVDIQKVMYALRPFTEQEVENLKLLLKQLKPTGGLGISDSERQMILKAMAQARDGGVRQGAWYKCPNGHIYGIGDCGGAMVESTCPECKTRIGGGSHRLRADNALAREMDGATHSAWPEGAHMGNYDFRL